MATAVQKIPMSASLGIPFNKLVLSQSNVRRVKAGVSIEELAEDIARWRSWQRSMLSASRGSTATRPTPAWRSTRRASCSAARRLVSTTPLLRMPSTSEQLPQESGELWDVLLAFDTDSRDALFAHCVAPEHQCGA
jgi:ParB family transcriptional regulator, chromosome partitioning protein